MLSRRLSTKITCIEKEAQELAHANKILYDAHIKEGFTSEEALALVVATLN